MATKKAPSASSATTARGSAEDRKRSAWWEVSGIRWRIVFALLVIGGGLILLQPFLKKDAKFAIEALPGLYGLLAIAASAAVIILAVILRTLFERDEDYYGQ